MHLTKLTTGPAALLGVALLAAPLAAGTEYEIEVQNLKKGTSETTLIQADGDNLRIGTAKLGRKDQGGAIIFQGDRREGKEPRVIVLDEQGGHMVISRAMIDQVAKAMPQGAAGPAPVVTPEMQETMRRQIEAISDPEARARALESFEARFGTGAAGTERSKIEYVERGIRQENGYPCVRYEAMRDGVKLSDICATDWRNIEGGREAAKAFEAFEAFYRELMDTLADATGMDLGALSSADNPMQKITDLGRFPVRADEYQNGEKVRTSVLKSARKVDLDASVFKPGPNSVERKLGM